MNIINIYLYDDDDDDDVISQMIKPLRMHVFCCFQELSQRTSMWLPSKSFFNDAMTYMMHRSINHNIWF